MPTPTYWLEPTETVALGLRRYTAHSGGYTCEGGWHEALVWTGEGPAEFQGEGDRRSLAPADWPDSSRPNAAWPEECGRGCGYRFSDDDPRQSWQELLYVAPATGQRYTIHPQSHPPGVLKAGAGATYDAWWYPDAWRGPDGIALVVRCPNSDYNEWGVDMPSSSGGRWTRSGDPRAANVTASPSIAIGEPSKPGYYHGFLQAGVLTDHLG